MESISSEINQIFVKLLDGNHKLLNFSTPSISISALKHRIQTLTSVPSHHQLLSSNCRILQDDDQTLTLTPFPLVVILSLRLRGGKGGFGSLLRGAATKAGQKKTNNFDACRDMSGRRLRHVNAEKKLEEWRADAEERKLEKMAEDFLKKKSKEVARSGKRNGSDSAEKYVDKYREQSEKCMEAVEKSVRESVKEMLGAKRKGGSVANEADKKRMKIWLGKRKFGESDSDSEDIEEDDGNNKETEEGENEKSVVTDNGSLSDSSKDADRSSGSITGKELEIGCRDRGSSESGSEEEEVEKALISSASRDASGDTDKGVTSDNPVSECHDENMEVCINRKNQETVNEFPGASASELDVKPCAELDSNVQSESVPPESVSANIEVQDLEKPLNFDEYHSATELEVLGMEKLKSELQARGLKCGGTLPERAARLFLLKTTPLDKLPKKLFAKK